MINNKECIAMILAGGQGNRLLALTKEDAKPAVPFGGKYKIIDFTLSNCSNSGIDTIGILTQYQPLNLNEYVGNGQPWDLDRTYGGVQILPPYQSKNSTWYKGTANAIYQNINFIKRYNPKYVVILSGDHIYKMDYSKMLEFHKEKGASCTISVKNVSIKEASRFGILTADENSRITEFEEKPENPKSTLASMGIYIFSTDILCKYLEGDEHDPESSNDFGKNIIPKMINAGEKMFAYAFDGYWKDVGTISSLWEANMDLLGKNPVFSTQDNSWKIYYRSNAEPAQFIGEGAVIKNSIISEGSVIYGEVEDSVLSPAVKIRKGAKVLNSVIFQGVEVMEGATIENAIVDTGCIIGCGAKVGCSSGEITVLSKSTLINNGDIYTERNK